MAASVETRLEWLMREQPVLLLILWTGLLLAIHGPQQSMMAHDEGFYAQQARVMVESGDWITQHWWGALMYDRAMGLQWLIAASYSLFGISEFTARLPVMLACVGSVLLTYAIGTRFSSRPTALLGAAILTATPIWMQASKLATQDVPLVFFELLGIWALLRAEDAGARRLLWGALAGLSVGLAFFVKGFMVVPAAVAVLPYLIWEHRRHRHLANPGLYLGFLLSLVPTLVWFALSYRMHGWEPLENYFGKLLFLAQEDFHSSGPFYYLWNVPANAFPWPFLAVAGAVVALRNEGFRRLSLFIGFPVLLFLKLSFFTTRTWYYALQLLPFIALLAAVALMALGQRYSKRRGQAPIVLSGVLAALGGLLIVAALVVTFMPDLVAPLPAWQLVAVGLLGGTGLCLPLVVLRLERNVSEPSPRRWVLAWLAGPWLAIAALYGTGLWGNYNPAFKTQIGSPEIASVLDEEEVHFIFDANAPNSASPEPLLLAFYTPRTGRAFDAAAAIPDGGHAWVYSGSIHALRRPFEEIGTAGEWALIRFGNHDEGP